MNNQNKPYIKININTPKGKISKGNRSTRKIHNFIHANDGDLYDLRVIYKRNRSGTPTMVNEGEYTNKKDLLQVLKAFTEKPLLDDIYADEE